MDRLRDAADEIERLRTAISETQSELEAMKADRAKRNKTDPITRLHNLCDGLEEPSLAEQYAGRSREALLDIQSLLNSDCIELAKVAVRDALCSLPVHQPKEK